MIEGAQIGPGHTVLLVDDVVTTGGSILMALDAITQTGAETVAAVTLVDRSGIACQEFQQRGIAYYPMATYESFGIDPVRSEPLPQRPDAAIGEPTTLGPSSRQLQPAG